MGSMTLQELEEQVCTMIQLDVETYYDGIVGTEYDQYYDIKKKYAGLRDYYYIDSLYDLTAAQLNKLRDASAKDAEIKQRIRSSICSSKQTFIDEVNGYAEKARKFIDDKLRAATFLNWNRYDSTQIICLDSQPVKSKAFYLEDANTLYITPLWAGIDPREKQKILVHEYCHALTAGKKMTQFDEGIAEMYARVAYPGMDSYAYQPHVTVVQAMVKCVGAKRVVEANLAGQIEDLFDEGTAPGIGTEMNWALKLMAKPETDNPDQPAQLALFDGLAHYALHYKELPFTQLMVYPYKESYPKAYAYFGEMIKEAIGTTENQAN